jgi:thiol-disulfide isomerase/thioredoxin
MKSAASTVKNSCTLLWDATVNCAGCLVYFHVTYCVPGVLTVFMSGCYALYSSSSEVVDLNPANFDRLVIQSDTVWIVEFYAPWCGHCQQFVPEYSKAATALKVICGILSRR